VILYCIAAVANKVYSVGCVLYCLQTSVTMPTSEFMPTNHRPLVNSDGAQGMRSTYPAAMRAAQFGASNNLMSSQLAPRGGSSLLLSCQSKEVFVVLTQIMLSTSWHCWYHV